MLRSLQTDSSWNINPSMYPMKIQPKVTGVGVLLALAALSFGCGDTGGSGGGNVPWPHCCVIEH